MNDQPRQARARPPPSTPPTQTRRPPTRKRPGRKARPRACPYVTVGPGRGACFSLLAPRKLTYRLGSAGSWPSSSFRGGSSGTLRVPSSPPYTRAAAKTPPQACCKAPRTAEHPRPGTRAQDSPRTAPRMAPMQSGWGARDSPHTERGPARRLQHLTGPRTQRITKEDSRTEPPPAPGRPWDGRACTRTSPATAEPPGQCG